MRSILAIFTGFNTMIIVKNISKPILACVLSDDFSDYFTIYFISGVLSMFVAGYITALFTKGTEQLHAIILGIIVAVIDFFEIFSLNLFLDKGIWTIIIEIFTAEVGGYYMALQRGKK